MVVEVVCVDCSGGGGVCRRWWWRLFLLTVVVEVASVDYGDGGNKRRPLLWQVPQDG